MGHIVDNVLDAGSLCFLSGRSENRYTQRYFLEQPLLLPPLLPSGSGPNIAEKKINAEGVAVCGSHWCICRRCRATFSYFSNYSKPPENFVAYCWKKQKSAIVTEPRYFPGASVGVKYLNMRNFRLLGHIPHILVDDETLCPFPFSPRKGGNQRSLKTKSKTTRPTFQPITVFRAAF